MPDSAVSQLRAALIAAVTFTLPACAQPRAASPDAATPHAGAPLQDGVLRLGDSRMHLHCEGNGTPTVVFESGSGNDGTVWGGVVADIAPLTRACSYDRVGLGYSTRTKRTRTSQQMADELPTLLQAAELPPPYVLVARSAGAGTPGSSPPDVPRTWPAWCWSMPRRPGTTRASCRCCRLGRWSGSR